MEPLIEVKHLCRRFGQVVAIDDLSYSVYQGEVFGVLGPNGAGKTTNIRILNGVLDADSGEARVMGMDTITRGNNIRRLTGVLTEAPSLYERLSARENLSIFGTLYGVPEERLPGDVERILELFGLSERAEEKVGGFSKGMKQRLALGRAFLHNPQILFLDEPTSGLDPEAARQVLDLIEKISHQEGRTVFLCTHNLDEAQRLCDRVAVLDKGKLLAIGTLDELGKILWKSTWVDIQYDQVVSKAELAWIDSLDWVNQMYSGTGQMAVQVDDARHIPDLVAAIVMKGIRIIQVIKRKHTLEEIYFAYQHREVLNEFTQYPNNHH